MSKDYAKMRACSRLLPPPGGDVVVELLDDIAAQAKEITDLTTNINVQQREHESLLNDLQGEKDALTAELEQRIKTIEGTYRVQMDLTAERDKLNKRLVEVVAAAESVGWNGIENSKLLSQFIINLAGELAEANDYILSLKKDVEEGKTDLTVAIGLMNDARGERDAATARAELAEAGCVAWSLFGVWVGDGYEEAWIAQLPAGSALACSDELLQDWRDGCPEALANMPKNALIAWYTLHPIKGDDGDPGYVEFDFVRWETEDDAAKEDGQHPQPDPGQALAAELARLRRLDAAVQDDKLAARVVANARNNPTQYHEMDAIRDYRAGLNAAKEKTCPS